jgi:hypothetical protein
MSALLAWHNKIDNATLTSDATFVATLPLANLKSYVLPKVARTTDDNAFTITATFASSSVGCVAVANHTLGRTSQVQIKVYASATLVHDSGVLAVYPYKSGAIVLDDEIATLRHDYIYFLPANITATKVEFIFTPSDASYVEIGRLFVGETYEPSGGVDYGDQPLRYQDLSEIKTTPRGIRYAYQQQMLRSVDLALKYLPESEIFESIFDAQRRLGVRGEVIYAHRGRPTLANTATGLAKNTTAYAQMFLANFTELNPLNQLFLRGCNTVLRLLEVAV